MSDVQLYVLSCSISILNLVLNLVYRYLGTAVLDLISTKFSIIHVSQRGTGTTLYHGMLLNLVKLWSVLVGAAPIHTHTSNGTVELI